MWRKTTMSTTKTPWFVLNSPELGGPFADFYKSCQDKGVLDKRTRELLMTALACGSQCSDLIEEHIRAALEAGASKEEITEALLIATAEGPGTQLVRKEDLYRKYLG
jgi:AhpD family alkylhydroperoxidase